MSKVLESLVARGRRVRNFRESREITFGLADLSTNPDNHERLVKKGGIETLVNLLVSCQDAEAQQFAALAVGNTASTKALCNDIVKLDGVVAGLVKYVADEQGDSIGRQYSAMALGNILAEPDTHEIVVRSGCIAALILMLKNCCDGRELESGKHAAFAISNVSFDRRYHQQIVDEGAIELLVALSCCDDPDTQRQALSAVRGLCTTSDNRLLVLEKGILDPFILMSRSGDVHIVREVSSALNYLSSADENKEEISYRAMSTLISMLMSGDTEIERHSCCAIANLVEVTDIHSRFLDESGIPPLIALCSSPDNPCRLEASRAVANLSSNPDLIDILIQEKAIGPLVKSLEQDGDNCRFAALAVANFATHAPSLFQVVQAGAVPHLVALVAGPNNHVEGRRYGSLALANMTACEAFHSIILNEEGPQALFELASNSSDAVSQQFWGCALANLSSNTANHGPIVEMGGLQPLIALAYDSDQTVHKQAAAALRGFSATGNINMKIVHEGGLEPLCRLLQSEDHEVLHETTACLCNLSLGDENKFEIAKCGAVAPLISLIQCEDSTIAHYACECLANLAEMTDNQDFIAQEGAVLPCISAMRSRHIEVQRESGRLLANLGASSSQLAADAIVDGGGHGLLTSFLLSQDTNCQRAGAFGIGNLCTHDHHRRTLMEAGVLEPLTSLARSGKVELEIRRFSMLAIANLAACFGNHDDFVSQNTVPMLVSFSNSADAEIRNYAAHAIAQLSQNSDMMEIITEEGGLEPVLYLSRSDDKNVQKNVLAALTTLSFLDCNKSLICMNGALPPIADCINEKFNSVNESQLACCAIANLVEVASNMPSVVNHGCIPLLIGALDSESESVQRESARAIGNLAVNMDYCDLVIHHGVTKRLVACFQSRNCECQRMAAMALSNVSSNLKSHAELLEKDMLDLVKMECLASLDPKRFSDHETARFCILIVSNLTGGKQNHLHMDSFFDVLMDFTRHRDVKCRQHAILAIGNLCTNPLHIQRLLEVKCTDALVAFSFPPTTEDSVNAQFQAIAGLHGVSKQMDLRVPLLREGALEPLIICAHGNNRFSCVEIQREAAATLSNLALAEANRIIISKSGALPALVNLLKKSDSMAQVHAATALGNLAESRGEVHALLLSKQCLDPMCRLVQEESTHVDVKRAVSRCIALFASNAETHTYLHQTSVIDSVKILISTSDACCERYGALAISNLSLIKANHSILLESSLVELLLRLVNSDDIETLRGISFALHSLSIHDENHARLEHAEAVSNLVALARCGDRDTALQACLAIKYLCVCETCRNVYIESHGLEPLLTLATSDDLETKREVAAALRNISLSDKNKQLILIQGGMDIVASLCRDADNEVSHQACGVIANIAERQENKTAMVEQGIIHHLQFSMLSKSIPVLRESIRAFANLSSARANTAVITSSGALCHLMNALNSPDTLCRRFSAMTMANLASNDESKARIVREQGVRPLMSIITETEKNNMDKQSQQHAMACLANLASQHALHSGLLDIGCADLSMNYIKSSNLDIRTNALLCLSNFASNSKAHLVMKKCNSLSNLVAELILNLDCNDRLVQLQAITALRGLSTDIFYRQQIISGGGVEPLLSFVHLDDIELKMEVLSTLCNLSLGGCMGDKANTLLENVDMKGLISFLCNSDSTHRLFGAVAIGNIASHIDLQAPVFDSGALHPLIGLSDADEADFESQRCIAYAICNLSAEVPNRMSIILKGGLPSIMFLCRTGDDVDTLAALSTLRGLAASAEARRSIVEEGVFCVLSLAMKTNCLRCKREVASILVLLSLNEENKVDIIRSDEMKEFVTLTEMEDVQCISQVCRCIGNISEVSRLHSDILQVFTVEDLVRVSSHAAPLVSLEVTRCYANLASNFSAHRTIAKSQLLKNIGALCLNADADIRRFSSLALANLCLNADMHSALNGKDLTDVFYSVIDAKLPTSQATDAATFHKSIEGKCYACMGIGALCQDPPIVDHVIKAGMVPALLDMLQMEASEMNLHVTFVFNKLSMSSSAHEELYHQKVATLLTKHAQGTNTHALTYSIAALRRLSEDENIQAEMIGSNSVEFLAKVCDFDNIERCRETSSGIFHLTLWDDARLHIVASDVFGHIFKLAESPDVETSRFALGALANIADDSRFCDTVASNAGVVHSLLALIKDRNLSIVRESSRALSNLLSSMAAQTSFLKEEGLGSLANTSQMRDSECVYNAAVAFRKLSANVTSHEAFFSSDSVGAVINLTYNKDKNVQIQGAAALRDISSNREYKLAFAKKGGIRTAIELSSLPDIALKRIGLGIVRQLSIPMQLKRTLVDSGVVSIMADCVEQAKNKDILYQCASSIANMAEHAHNKIALVQMGVVHCLVCLCKLDCVQVKREAARAFSLLSSAPENNIGVLDKKVLPCVINLLRCEEEETGRDSAATISNVSTNPETNALIGNLGGIPPLILLLTSPYESCQISSAKALCRLTILGENKVLTFSHGGLKPLLQLCTSPNQDISLMATMVLCNLSTCSSNYNGFVEENGIPTLKHLLTSDCPLFRKHATMVLCNLTSHEDAQGHVAKQVNLLQLFDLMNDVSLECRAFATMTLCNLSSKQTQRLAILESGGMQPLASMVDTTDGTNIQRAALLALYNLSTCELSHRLFVENRNMIQSIVKSCRSPDVLCRRFALMVLANVACNDTTRADATKGGGLQAAILSLKDDDFSSRRFACICLANMGNDTTTQSQIVVHGGLPSLVTLCLVDSCVETQDCAFMCLTNLAANESNHSPLMKQGAFKAFAQKSSRYKHGEAIMSTFAISNLTSNSEVLSQIGREGGIRPLIALAKSENLHSQCLALSSLRRLGFIRENRERLVAEGILDTLASACNTAETEIQREVASCFCFLSLSSNHHLAITRKAISRLMGLTKSNDVETIRYSLGAIANLAEGTDTHPLMLRQQGIIENVVDCLERNEIDIKREAARAICNLLSSCEIHPQIIQRGLDSLILLSAYSSEECRYLTALSFRKLSPTISSHHSLINDGLQNILSLVREQDIKTRKHAATTLRDLSATGKDNILFFKLGAPVAMVELVNANAKDIQIVAVAALRHLSSNKCITEDFSSSGIAQSVIRCISWANEDLRCQIAGLLANLSEHRECQPTLVSNGIIEAIDNLLLIEHDEIWQDCARTLANLCANEGKQSMIHRQGGLKTLAKLSKSKGDVCQRYAAIAMRFMSSSIEVQNLLANGKESFIFLEFSCSNQLDFQRAAAAAFASMSLNQIGKSLVLRKGGIKPILQLCIHLDLTVRRDAIFCVSNLASSSDFRQYVVKDGGVETIKAAAIANNDVELLRDASRAMSSFSADTPTKEIMIAQEVPKVLCRLAKSSDSSTQRFASLALCNLCSIGAREQKELVVKQGVLSVLLFLLRFPDLEVERCASLAIAALSLGSDRNKAEVIDNGFIRPLIETTMYPDTRMRQCALLALNGIAIGEMVETKERIFNENGLPSLLALIKSEDDESIHAGLYILGTLAENMKIRDAIVAMDCLQMVVEKSSLGSIEIKRAAAYFLSLLSECPEYHDGIRAARGLESVVGLASLVDEECQDYGAFTLAFLANNKSFQVPLAKLGGVRPLVSMMATDSESKHYAALALLKLADNFENHVTIAEEGGINALLKLGKSKISSETMQYKAALTVGKLAKDAAMTPTRSL